MRPYTQCYARFSSVESSVCAACGGVTEACVSLTQSVMTLSSVRVHDIIQLIVFSHTHAHCLTETMRETRQLTQRDHRDGQVTLTPRNTIETEIIVS